MQYTLLKIVQKTLAYVDDFNVNSVDETEESEQIVQLVNQVYLDLVSRKPWPHLKEFGSLEATTDPHILKLPTDVLTVDWIRYDGKRINYISPEEMQEKFDSRDTTLAQVDSNGVINDTNPREWTSNDDFNIIFDSYDGSLLANSSTCYFTKDVSELNNDNDVPDLPERFHTTLLYGVIAEASRVVKGDVTQGAIYDKKFAAGVARMHRWARRVNKKETTMPNDYGRKNQTYYRRRNVIDAGSV